MREIDADALWMDIIHSMDYCEDILEIIERQPTITPERKQGFWIVARNQNKEDTKNGNYRFICSVCGCSDVHSKAVAVPHCWNCGTAMQEGEG